MRSASATRSSAPDSCARPATRCGGAAAIARVELFADGARGWQVDVDRASASDLLDARSTPASSSSDRPVRRTRRDRLRARLHRPRRRDRAREAAARNIDEGPRTIALVGVWRRDGGWPVPDDSHTLIESYDDGWMWSVPIGAGLRHIAAMVDPQRSELARGGSSSGCLSRRDREDAGVQGDLIAGASIDRRAARLGCVAVSRQRICRRAVAAGRRCRIVHRSAVVRGREEGAGLGVACRGRREHRLEDAVDARARVRVLLGARGGDRAAPVAREPAVSCRRRGRSRPPFWDDRSDEQAEEEEDVDADPAGPRSTEGARALAAANQPAISIQPRPIVRGNEIVLEPHLVSVDRSARRPLRARRRCGRAGRACAVHAVQVPDLYEAYVEAAGTVPLHDFLFAVATAVARGWLVAE